MDRMEEYQKLRRDLERVPPELEDMVQRARARARRHRVQRLFEVPAASIAGVLAAFMLLVNLSTPFALACGRIPVLKELAAAVAFSPSLKAAVENDYVQVMDLTQAQNGVAMTVEYVIVDNKQVHIFYTTESGDYSRFSVIPDLFDAEGGALEGYSITSGSPTENGSLCRFIIDFAEGDVPERLRLTCRLIPLEEETSTQAAPERDDGSRPEYAEPDPVATLTFDLRFDPAYTDTGEIVTLNRWISLDGQRILAKDVEIYPTHIRLNLGDDVDNTAWLKSLDFYLEDERGNRYEKIGSGITATGSTDSYFMAGHRLESSYFGDAKHLTVHITGATWLDKDMEYTEVDLKAGTAGPLPDWLRLEDVERLSENRYRLVFSAPFLKEGGYYQLLRWDYLDEAGEERSYEERSSMSMENNSGRFTERVILEDYPYRTVQVGLSATRTTQLDTPLEVPVK
ncbi:MAG: DUF4179 domain-containing protein [Oscillospiraceae bacterium]|nr:DUF4179 domain-containing protein [Oscillospiraceae bacterium]